MDEWQLKGRKGIMPAIVQIKAAKQNRHKQQFVYGGFALLN